MKSLYLLAIVFLLSLPLAAVLASSHCEGSIDAAQACAQEQNRGTGLQFDLDSPLSPNIITIEDLLVSILNVLLVLAVPIIVFFLIFAGFTYVTAQGNPEKIKTATRSLTYAIIGGVLILGGVAISEIIASVVESFRN